MPDLRKEKSVATMQGATLKIEVHRWLRRGIKVNVLPGLTVPKALARFPAGRTLPKKFFGGYISIVVFAVRDLRDELIHLNPIVVHGARRQVTLGGVLNSSSSLNWLGT